MQKKTEHAVQSYAAGKTNNIAMLSKGAFNNHVDKRGWVGGLKFAIFSMFFL